MPQFDEDSPNSRGEPGQRGNAARTGTFACSGEFWTVGYRTATFSLRDSKGLSHIQRLLRCPGEQFHALDLLIPPGTGPEPTDSQIDIYALPVGVTVRRGLSGDAGEILDAPAKRDYKRRLDELKEQLEDLIERGDQERAAEVESEMDILKREISNAFGIGGRDRRAGSIAERARLNVTRSIKAALLKVSERQAEFGEMLNRSIRTGLFCSYAPDPRAPINWQFSLESVDALDQLETAEPLFSRRESRFLQAFKDGTEFVGREREREALSRALERAAGGQGGVVLIGGAAGVGKTRMAAEIAVEASRNGVLTYVGSCYDRDDPVPFGPFVEILEAALAQAPTPSAFRQALDKDAGEMAWLLPQLRRLFPDIPPPLELAPEQSRRILFGAFAELLARNARNTPILLLLDDLHWADEATLSLLNHLAQLVPKMRALIVGTYRDYGLDPSSPLTSAFDELIRLHLVDRINLSGLSRDSVAAMLRALSRREPPDLVVRLFYTDTEGNPFFVEELFRHLVEQGKLTDSSGEFRRDFKFVDLDVPQSLRLLIGRRLLRLSDSTQKTLATAAVIGRSFTFELLAASTQQKDADSLLDCVEEAERAGLISSTVQYPEAQFRFSHELIRQAVARTLSVVRRRRLHLDIANAVESVYADTLEDHANDLAYHLWEAGTLADPAKTVRYIAMVARRESHQGALTEAEGHYLQALTALGKMPETHERDEHELVLRLGLGSVSIATHGYKDARTAAAYDRAGCLGERLGDPGLVVLALAGRFAVPLLRGETEATRVLADKVLAASELDGRPKTRIWGHMLQGVSRYQRGELAAAYNHLGQAIKLYSEEDHSRDTQDPFTDSLEYMAHTAWRLGMADSARARMEEAIALAARLGKPYVFAHNRFFAAYLYALMRDPRKSREFAEAAIEHAREQQIPLFYDAARILWGWALAEQGSPDEGLASAREGLASYRDSGNRNEIGALLGFLAEAQARCGSIDGALATVKEGIAYSQKQRVDLPQLFWLRGELLSEKLTRSTAVASTEASDLAEAAESSFREALSVAGGMGAKSYALRAATSLGRLLKMRGRASEVRELVFPIWKSFSEGFDTRDWLEAKAMLDELS
jgi:tetratricopeptide (TPR) repeat protein